MNCEYENIIEYLEYKADGYAKEKEFENGTNRWLCLDIKENTIREIISDIKNGEHLDF